MPRLGSISLLQFKNYPQTSFTFSRRIVGICGPNGIGKTNLLDAIYYLCFTRSYFSKTDSQHVLFGAQGFRIAGCFLPADEAKSGGTEVVCVLRESGKKELYLEGEAYEKFSQHIGRFPAVAIVPDDVLIITGPSEERRRFLDALLCQIDANYLQHLMKYSRTLQQRNSYLKSLTAPAQADHSLLDSYDLQLCQYGNYIFEQRSQFLLELIPLVQELYQRIAGSEESVSMDYESSLQKQPFEILLKQSREKDIILQRTTQGIHRDDLLFALQEQPFKSFASQGQRKSLLYALKLGEFDMLKQYKGDAPLLLLDDVFEKLDEQRMSHLLHYVCVANTGQVFITDTQAARLQKVLGELQQGFQLIDLKKD